MKSISVKLFLALLGLTTLVLIATLLLARWSFEQGFQNYVKAQELTRLNAIARDLGEDYKENGLRWPNDIDGRFEEVYQKWYPDQRRGKRSRKSKDHKERKKQHSSREKKDRRDWRDGSENRSHSRGKHKENRPPPTLKLERGLIGEANFSPDKQRSPRRKHSKHRALPTTLFDADEQYLAGFKGLNSENLVVVDIIVLGEKVGSLKTMTLSPSQYSLEESSFYQQQNKVSILIALISLMLASLASFFLARMLLSPIISIKKSVRHLADGDFTQRLGLKRNDELGVLMQDIDNLGSILELNRHSRRRWLADISHELRTPVTILSGEIDALNDGVRTLDAKQLKSFSHEVDRLKHLINDLYELSLSDIGGLRYEFKTVEMTQLIKDVALSYEERFKSSGLSITLLFNENIEISGDTKRLEQLVTNLLNNSIAYTDKPGELTIQVNNNHNHATFAFYDTPPSVPNEKLESLFEPLYREDKSRSRRVAGAGLGLTICRNIVKAHNGIIIAKPSSLGGLCIEITLPLKNKR